MPATQHGSVIKHRGAWQARWFDASGQRRSRNVRTKSEGLEFLQAEIERVETLKAGGAPEAASAPVTPATVDELLDAFLANWSLDRDRATVRKVTSQLKHARRAFGSRHPESLRKSELRTWRASLSGGVQHDAFRALHQAFRWAVDDDLLPAAPTQGVENNTRPRAERKKIKPFGDWAEVEAIAAEIDPRFRAIAIVLVDTGMRPEELFGLHKADLDLERREFTLRRRYTQLAVKDGLKRGEAERIVPFTQRTVDALKAMPPRLDTQVLFPAPQGGYINLSEFRYKHWLQAFKAAGVDYRTLYDCRHTAMSWALSAGVPPAKVALIFGTSIKQIDATYSHIVPSDYDAYRAAMEAYAARQAVNE